MNQLLKNGILISSNCPKYIIDLACSLWGKDGYLLNQTFHKSLGTVVNSTREELVIQQILHYITTYGLEALGKYDEKFVYIPNEKLEVPELENDIKLIRIEGITADTLKEKLWLLCASAIPLSKDSIESIIELSDYLEVYPDNIETIKNKELKAFFYKKLDLVPEKADEFMRYLIYCLINQTLLIKDKATLQALEDCKKDQALHLIKRYIEEYDIKSLAEVFNRFKPLFLSLKTRIEITREEDLKKFATEIELNAIINKISHLSKKYHKPFKTNELDTFINWCIENNNTKDFEEVLTQKLEQAGIWRVIKLRNYLEHKKINSSNQVYKIRNGKAWIEKENKSCEYDLTPVFSLLDDMIVNKLKSNVTGKKILLDNNIDLKIPTSEKQFVGNIPFGSTLSLEKDNLLFGIHWFNVNKARVDLDLKLISNEYSIGWDAEYNETDKLIHSGDVTDAPYPNGASEYVYVDKEIGNTMFSLKINNYTEGVDNIEYEIIIAKGDKEALCNNYIVDPNDILIKIPNNKIELGQLEHTIGSIVIDKDKIKLIFTDLSTANRITASNSELEDVLRQFTLEESECCCNLKTYLEKAGAIIVNNNDCDIDLSINGLTKESIITLLM